MSSDELGPLKSGVRNGNPLLLIIRDIVTGSRLLAIGNPRRAIMAIQIVMDRTGDSRNTASTRTTGKNWRRRSRASPPPSGPVRVRCPESDRSTRTRKRRCSSETGRRLIGPSHVTSGSQVRALVRPPPSLRFSVSARRHRLQALLGASVSGGRNPVPGSRLTTTARNTRGQVWRGSQRCKAS